MKFPQSSPLFGSSNHGGNNGIVRLLRASTDFKTEVTRITKRGAWRHRHKKIASSSPFITVGYKAQKWNNGCPNKFWKLLTSENKKINREKSPFNLTNFFDGKFGEVVRFSLKLVRFPYFCCISVPIFCHFTLWRNDSKKWKIAYCVLRSLSETDSFFM